jgi:flagellar hook-associated protein 2
MVDIVNTLNAGAGIDIKSLAKNLTDSVRLPQQAALETRKSALTATISSVGKIMSVVNTFSSAITAVGNPQSFQRTPASSDPTKVRMDFVDGTTAPTFTGKVAVTRLATETSVLFRPLTSLDDDLAGTDTNRTLTLMAGDASAPGSALATIDLKLVNTLPALRDRINQIPGFEATIIKGGTEAAPLYYLGMKGKLGEENRFFVTITTTTDDVVSDASGSGFFLNGAEVVRQGNDALIEVDGVQIASTTNDFNDVLPGLTITALATTSSEVTLSSNYNIQGLSDAMVTIVSGFNLMLETIKTETTTNVDSKTRGGLSNNSAIRSLLGELRRFTTQGIAGFNDGVHTLAELGVRTNRDGSLSLDEVVFARALKQTPDIVEAVLASKKQITDTRLSIVSSTGAQPGKYQSSKSEIGQWKINNELATASAGRLTSQAGSLAEGLIIRLPADLEAAAPVGYSTTVYFSKGLIERLNEMFKSLSNSQSSIQLTSTNASKSLSDITLEQTKLDTKMKAIEDRYLKQFTQMNSIVSAGNNTQSSLKTFIDSRTAGLRG